MSPAARAYSLAAVRFSHSQGMCSVSCPSSEGCDCPGFVEDAFERSRQLMNRHHRYNTSEKGRMRSRVYGTSDAGRDRHRRYNRSEKGRARGRDYLRQKGQK